MSVRVQLRPCSPGRGTRWPVSFLQDREFPADEKSTREMKARPVEEDAGVPRGSPVSGTEDDDGEDAGRLCLGQSRRAFYSSPVHLGANGVGQERCSQNK